MTAPLFLALDRMSVVAQVIGAVLLASGAGVMLGDFIVGILRLMRRRALSSKGPITMPADWPGVTESAPYVWTGGAGLMGRLMFHSHQVQRGKRKPLSWSLAFDVPIAVAMGWLTLGLCDWLNLAPQPTISLAIAAGHLGPYSIDRAFSALAERYLKSGPSPAAEESTQQG